MPDILWNFIGYSSIWRINKTGTKKYENIPFDKAFGCGMSAL
jgi:hypothetical protein